MNCGLAQRSGHMGQSAVRASPRQATAPGHHDDAEADQIAQGAREARRPGRRRDTRPTADNAANLAPSFLTQIVGRYEGTRLGRQELNAEILEDVQGALGRAI